jgi:hypothetical protein
VKKGEENWREEEDKGDRQGREGEKSTTTGSMKRERRRCGWKRKER